MPAEPADLTGRLGRIAGRPPTEYLDNAGVTAWAGSPEKGCHGEMLVLLEREEIRQLREKLQAYLDIFGEDNDLRITVGSATFTEDLVQFKVELAPFREDGTAATRQSEDFKRYCCRHDLEPTDLGRTFQHGPKTYKLVGLRPRSPAYALLCQDET